MDTDVEKRLRQWARWWKEVETNQLGYPESSSIAMFGSGNLATEAGKSTLPIKNLQAWEMDLLINRMGFYNLEFKRVVTLVYLSNEPITKLAYDLKCSRRTIHLRLQHAKAWLDGALAVSEEIK